MTLLRFLNTSSMNLFSEKEVSDVAVAARLTATIQ